MPDVTPVDGDGGPPHDPAMEWRVARLEEDSRAARADMRALHESLNSFRAEVLAGMAATRDEILTKLAGVENGLLAKIVDVDKGLRADIADVDKGLRADIANVEKGLRADIANVDKGLRADIANVEKSLRADIADVDRGVLAKIADVEKDVAELKGRVSQLPSTWVMLTGMIAAMIGLAGLVFAITRLTIKV